jgi:hypothetical protein
VLVETVGPPLVELLAAPVVLAAPMPTAELVTAATNRTASVVLGATVVGSLRCHRLGSGRPVASATTQVPTVSARTAAPAETNTAGVARRVRTQRRGREYIGVMIARLLGATITDVRSVARIETSLDSAPATSLVIQTLSRSSRRLPSGQWS